LGFPRDCTVRDGGRSRVRAARIEVARRGGRPTPCPRPGGMAGEGVMEHFPPDVTPSAINNPTQLTGPRPTVLSAILLARRASVGTPHLDRYRTTWTVTPNIWTGRSTSIAQHQSLNISRSTSVAQHQSLNIGRSTLVAQHWSLNIGRSTSIAQHQSLNISRSTSVAQHRSLNIGRSTLVAQHRSLNIGRSTSVAQHQSLNISRSTSVAQHRSLNIGRLTSVA
jgi:hypothetical protein